MEEDGEDLTPFWVQRTTNRGRGGRFSHGLSSFFLSSGLLVSILLVTAVSFLVFVVPSSISFSSQILRPNNVKKSWDSLNLVLVLFALVFGFLSRNKNEDRNFDEYQTTSPNTGTETQKSNPSTPQGWYNYSSIQDEKSNPSNHVQWYGYSDQTVYNTSSSSRGVLMRRTSSSYPDLLEVSSRLSSGDDPWRSYDDMNIDTSRYSDTFQLQSRRSWKYSFDDSQLESKNLYGDKFVNHHPKESSHPPTPAPPSSPPPATSPAQPSLPPVSPALPPASPPLQNEKPKRAHRSVGHKRERRKRKDNQLGHKEPISEPATPPPPPPPPPPLPQFVDQNIGKSEKKRTGGTATKDFLNSLNHKKKKKQRQKSVENFDALLHEPHIPPLHFQLPPPSPPPPPPPPSVFHNLFSSNKSKRKTVISVPIPAPPSPPPTVAISSRPKTYQFEPVAAQKSPQPVKVRSFGSDEGNSNSGGESPLIPIPPPPPPPPFFKSPVWKFVLQGDYVRVNSNLSSRSGSPEPDDVESDGTPTAADGGDASPFPASPLFCPSPDVDTKAENFISKFRAGLKLEKIDSMNKRQGLGLSNLGRGSGPTHI